MNDVNDVNDVNVVQTVNGELIWETFFFTATVQDICEHTAR